MTLTPSGTTLDSGGGSGSGAVSSVFTRTGAVVAVANDYFNVQGRRSTLSAPGDSGTLQVHGDNFSVTGSTSFGNPTSTLGIGWASFSGSTNVPSGFQGLFNYRVGRNIRAQIIAGPAGKITDERYWFGLTDRSIAQQGGSDNPASGIYAMFRFSTAASDTHWQCITKDGTTQTIVDSGITPAINTMVVFAIVFDDSAPNVKFYINGVLVATITTHLPTSGTNLAIEGTNTCFTSTTSNGFWFSQATMITDF